MPPAITPLLVSITNWVPPFRAHRIWVKNFISVIRTESFLLLAVSFCISPVLVLGRLVRSYRGRSYFDFLFAVPVAKGIGLIGRKARKVAPTVYRVSKNPRVFFNLSFTIDIDATK